MGDDKRARPIYSSRADDPAFIDTIDAFVISLAERIDDLQDADRHGDLKQLADLARALASDSVAAGFALLAGAAQAVEAVCSEEDTEAAHRSVVELTGIAQRIRLGHPGAL
jgi:HPt (histidine-containing phosphotransfer) domain-containing protein